MATKIQAADKTAMVQAIVAKFNGAITVKRAKKIVEQMGQNTKFEVNVKVPSHFRFRNAKGHFVKTPS